METEEQQFIKGFNGGYLIAKHEPELSARILDVLQPSNTYTRGLILGKNEWIREKELAQLEELSNLRNSLRDIERSMDE
jgi:hypothetical protein